MIKSLKDIIISNNKNKRIKIEEQIDKIFGGIEKPGLSRSCLSLLSGTPGVGKSTFLLQLLDMISRNNSELVLLYNTCEETLDVIKSRADRMKLDSNFLVSDIKDINELIDECKRDSVDILVQDSVQTIQYENLSGIRLIKNVCSVLRDWKNITGGIAILTGHVTKSGVFAGPNWLKHDIDMHVHMSFSDSHRLLTIGKNRFGPSDGSILFDMTNNGLVFFDDDKKNNNNDYNDNEMISFSYSSMANDRISKAKSRTSYTK